MDEEIKPTAKTLNEVGPEMAGFLAGMFTGSVPREELKKEEPQRKPVAESTSGAVATPVVNKPVSEAAVKDWMLAQIHDTLDAMDVKDAARRDEIESAVLSGIMNVGGPSDEAADKIKKMVVNLISPAEKPGGPKSDLRAAQGLESPRQRGPSTDLEASVGVKPDVEPEELLEPEKDAGEQEKKFEGVMDEQEDDDREPPDEDDRPFCKKCGEQVPDAEWEDNHGYCAECAEEVSMKESIEDDEPSGDIVMFRDASGETECGKILESDESMGYIIVEMDDGQIKNIRPSDVTSFVLQEDVDLVRRGKTDEAIDNIVNRMGDAYIEILSRKKGS